MITTLGEQVGALVALATLGSDRLAGLDLAEFALGAAAPATARI